MSVGKFLKPWQMTAKIIEWIFMQFTFNIIWVTLTQKIITHRFQKFMNGYEGICMNWGKFIKPWQMTAKIIVFCSGGGFLSVALWSSVRQGSPAFYQWEESLKEMKWFCAPITIPT